MIIKKNLLKCLSVFAVSSGRIGGTCQSSFFPSEVASMGKSMESLSLWSAGYADTSLSLVLHHCHTATNTAWLGKVCPL